MQILQALILGVVQGLTEFIPVSSSGHLILVGHLLNFQYSGLGFDTALDIGTLAALLLFFRRDIVALVRGLFQKTEMTPISWFMVVATIPAVIAGVLLQSAAETVFRSSQLVALNLIVVALVMLAADRMGKRNLHLKDMTWGKSTAIGLAQALALVPGVSRSGITISAGLFAGFDRITATRFSFLLSAPVIGGATAKVVLTPSNFHELTAQPLLYAVGIISAFISGYLAIRFMLSYLNRHGLAAFAYYRIVVGVLILAIGLK
jgi:undecaprenyl-diphosphatase